MAPPPEPPELLISDQELNEAISQLETNTNVFRENRWITSVKLGNNNVKDTAEKYEMRIKELEKEIENLKEEIDAVLDCFTDDFKITIYGKTVREVIEKRLKKNERPLPKRRIRPEK